MGHLHKAVEGILCKRGGISSGKKVHVHASVGENQQKQILEDFHNRKAFFLISIRRFQRRRNMKSSKKSSYSYGNLVFILSVLCYTFIHSMMPPVLIVFGQLNYTKPDGIHAIFMPVIIEF